MRDDVANDRFKRRFDDVLWGSIAVAALVHGLVFGMWPRMATADVSFDVGELDMVELPPEIVIPPPPEVISRPAMPVVSDAVIDEEITIAETTFAENPALNVPPPPTKAAVDEDIARAPVFVPHTVSPRVLNKAEVVRAAERNYPSLLRDAGIGGSVEVWFLLDLDGSVLKTQLKTPSRYEALNEAALRVAAVMRFSPAYNLNRTVQVWASQSIVFQPR